MTQEKQLKQIEDALKDPQGSPKVWTKVRRFLETAADRGKTTDVVNFKDGSILEELYKAIERKTCSGQTDAVDDILESITILSETERGKEIGWTHMKALLDIAVKKITDLETNLEICKHLNLLLGKLPKSKLTEHKKASEFDEFLKAFEELLKEAGDYDFQATLVEAVLRILEPGEKENYAQRWFPDSNIRDAFLAIKNQDFENGCRNFLNIMNKGCGDNRSVHSVPCNGLYLGMYQVNVPDGQVDRNIWVDFNLGSKSVSAFVRDDSSGDVGDSSWETMIIKVQHVRDLRINDSDDVQILILKLTMPASELVPFCPKSSEHYAKILFSKEYNISSAIFKLFGAVRYIDLPYSSPSISSTPSKASTAKQPCIISSKNDRNARSWKLQEMLTEPPFVVASKDEKTSMKSETKSIIVDCNDEVSTSTSFKVVTGEDKPTIPTAHASNRENENDVIPETQDAELQVIEQKSSNKPTEKKESKSKTKSLIQPRLPRPRKAKTSAVSPFSYKEPDSSKTEPSSITPVRPSVLKTQNSDKGKRDEREGSNCNDIVKQKQCSDEGEIQKGSSLEEEETKSRFSFTDPKKRRKNLPKKTFENLRRKKRRSSGAPRANKHDWKNRSLVKGAVRNNQRLSSDSDSESSMSIPPYHVGKRATKWKGGKSKKRKFNESDSDVDARFSKYQLKRSNTVDAIRKSRKKQNTNEGKIKSQDVSIADLVNLYGKRNTSEEASKARKKTKPKNVKGRYNNSNHAIEQADDNSKEMGTLSFVRARKATKITETLIDDSDNEISWSNDDGEQAEVEPIQSENRNNGHLRKKSKLDSIEKKVEHHSTSILVNTSDPESEVDIEDELKSKKVNDTFPDDSSNPVSSFAKICQDILDRSNRYAVIQLSDDEHNVKNGERNNIRKFLDSGIVSDTSVRRSNGTSTFAMHEETQDNCTAPQLPETNITDVDSDNEKEDEAENNEDEESDGGAHDTLLPHLKTPDVVKEFRSRCKVQGKEKQNPNKQKKLKRIVTCSDDEENDEWNLQTSRKRTKKRTKDGTSKARFSDTNDEITPLANIDQNNFAIPSYGVGPLLNTLRDRVTGEMKRKESELQRFTSAAADLVNDKLKKIWSVQREERLEFLSGVDKKLRKEVASIRQDAERQQERQEKFLELVLEHQRESIKASKDQIKRINNLENINSTLLSGIKDLENKHTKNENFAEEQLRKEISKLHTKLLHESRRKEILNVRKTLHTALSAM